MPYVEYDGDYPSVVTGDGAVFTKGEPVEVDAKTAKTLADRDDFKSVPKPKP